MKHFLSILLATTCCAVAQQAPVPAPTDAAPLAQDQQKKLPYGVEDVLKLSRAQVGDDIIVKYIRNTGTVYSLTPETIVYLKDQGVSETVINAMIDQPRNAAGTTSTWASQAPAQMPAQQQPAPTYTQAPVPAPTTPPPAPQSSVYVIPSYPSTYYYYDPYPYWYGYSGPYWYGPSISLGFGFGFGGHHGGFRGGGFHVGGFHGGGFHGGGFHGGFHHR